MKRYGTPLITRETQIQTTIRYHPTPAGMANTDRQTTTSAGEAVKLEPSHTAGGVSNGEPVGWQFLESETQSYRRGSNSIPGDKPKRNENIWLHRHLYVNLDNSIAPKSQRWKQPTFSLMHG